MHVSSLEDSYIRHILVAAQARDFSAPWRTFFDNWFAFRVGGPFLNRNSRPHWFNNPCPDRHGEALRRAHFISVTAARVLAGISRDRLVKDHAIPVSVLRDIIFDDQPESLEDVRALMLRHYRIGIITHAEDGELSRAGLRSDMPHGWRRDGDPFARYREAGITAQDLGWSGSAIQWPRNASSEPKIGGRTAVARLLNSATAERPFDRHLHG